MTEGKQHEERVQALKDRLPHGSIILENDNERGKGGYRFPRSYNGREEVEYVADVFAILPNAQPVILESDGTKPGQGHFTDRAVHRDTFRDAFFHRYGIITQRYPTKWIDEGLTESDIMADIQYKTRELFKKLSQRCVTPTPKLTTA